MSQAERVHWWTNPRRKTRRTGAPQMTRGDPKTPAGREPGVLSARVPGGALLTGGVATISAVLVGVLIMGSVQDAMSLMNVSTFYQYLIRGGILLFAVLFDQYRRSKRVHGCVRFTHASAPAATEITGAFYG